MKSFNFVQKRHIIFYRNQNAIYVDPIKYKINPNNIILHITIIMNHLSCTKYLNTHKYKTLALIAETRCRRRSLCTKIICWSCYGYNNVIFVLEAIANHWIHWIYALIGQKVYVYLECSMLLQNMICVFLPRLLSLFIKICDLVAIICTSFPKLRSFIK